MRKNTQQIVMTLLLTKAREDLIIASRDLRNVIGSEDDTTLEVLQKHLDSCDVTQAIVDGLTFVQTRRRLSSPRHGRVSTRARRKFLLAIRQELADLAQLIEKYDTDAHRAYGNYKTAWNFVDDEYNRITPRYNPAANSTLTFMEINEDDNPSPTTDSIDVANDYARDFPTPSAGELEALVYAVQPEPNSAS